MSVHQFLVKIPKNRHLFSIYKNVYNNVFFDLSPSRTRSISHLNYNIYILRELRNKYSNENCLQTGSVQSEIASNQVIIPSNKTIMASKEHAAPQVIERIYPCSKFCRFQTHYLYRNDLKLRAHSTMWNKLGGKRSLHWKSTFPRVWKSPTTNPKNLATTMTLFKLDK